MSDRLVIDSADIRKILDTAMCIFHETRYLPDSPKESQAFLILSGLHSFLISRGLEPQFEVKPVKEAYVDGSVEDL
jgi:hypothetical protein